MTSTENRPAEKLSADEKKASLSFELQGFINGLRFSEGWDHAKFIDRIQAAIPRIKILEEENEHLYGHVQRLTKAKLTIEEDLVRKIKAKKIDRRERTMDAYWQGYNVAIDDILEIIAATKSHPKPTEGMR